MRMLPTETDTIFHFIKYQKK